jgi:luciferase family oxidoreductase group 1
MKFGLFFEIQNPKPWTQESESRAFHEAIEQAVLADQLGYDTIWHAEHHFLEEYSHNSAPEIVLAAIAAKTKRIRIGHGIKHMTTNHPLRVIEQAATLDIISNGRLELGLGEGSNTTELHPFGVRFREKRDHWVEAVQASIPAFWNESWSYESPRFSFPPRNVLPKPVQRPHPPLWVACSQTETIRQAGRWGLGAMGHAFVDNKGAEIWINAYYNAFLDEPERLADYVPNPQVATSFYFLCAPTDEQAIAAGDGATFFEFSLGFYQKHGPFDAGKTDFWGEYEKWKVTEKGVAKQQFVKESMLIGSPDTLRERIRRLQDLHVDEVVMIAQTGKTSHKEICDSMELFAKEVMPEFQSMEPEHQAWKQKVLSREIVLEKYETQGVELRDEKDVVIDQAFSHKPKMNYADNI